MKRLAWLAACLCGAAVGPLSQAEVTRTDLQVAARAMSFMEEPLSGIVRVGVIYVSAQPASLRDAELVRSQLGDGLRVGNIELRPTMVPLDTVATADVDLFLLTGDVLAHDKRIAAVSSARQIPCVTTDVRYVRSGACAMAIRSTPNVEIIVNRDAAHASGMRFATAFRVMITEL